VGAKRVGRVNYSEGKAFCTSKGGLCIIGRAKAVLLNLSKLFFLQFVSQGETRMVWRRKIEDKKYSYLEGPKEARTGDVDTNAQ